MKKWLDEKKWKKLEEDTAKSLKGYITAGSGNQPLSKGDVKSKKYLCENKQTTKKSISIKVDWLTKINKEAQEKNLTPLLIFRLEQMPVGNRDWVIMRKRDFDEYEE